MELNWSTFVLEIVNFLVLVWILKRFLYKPVLEVIARRRAGIEQTLAEARQQQADAQQLKADYEGRLAQWDRERTQARQALDGELEQERTRARAALQAELELQREKARVSEARRSDDLRRRTEEAALAQGASFATRLLEQAAGADVEARLIELLLSELGELPDERLVTLRNHWAVAPQTIVVTTAFPLAEPQQRRLEQAIADATGLDVPVRFERDATLLAGANIVAGPWILRANLRDELRGFAELAHGD
jgi:F-type H+-transporting ATPase subunit b